MARNHARWQLGALSTDPELRARTPHAKLVYVFLVQDTYLNPAGVLIACEESWADDLGLTCPEMTKALGELEDNRFIIWDKRSHELLVRSYIRNDGVAAQPNVLKQALAHARRIKSADLRRVLASELRRLPQPPPPKDLPNGRTMVYPDPHACADEIEVAGTPPQPPSGKALKKSSRNPSEKGVQTAFEEPPGEGEGEGDGERSARTHLPKPPAGASAQQLVTEWIDSLRHRPPGSVIARTGKEIKAMLAEGIDPGDVRAGMTVWSEKGLNPAALPSVVNQVMNRPTGRSHLRAVSGGHIPWQNPDPSEYDQEF